MIDLPAERERTIALPANVRQGVTMDTIKGLIDSLGMALRLNTVGSVKPSH